MESSLKATVFFSWQSDIKSNRNFIEKALERAANEVASDGSIGIEPVVDRDTRGVPGAPDIGTTILTKVRGADVFVGDVTIINDGSSGRTTPNPNVLVEVGYALATLGDARVVLIQNRAYGPPEALPFDLRQKRALVYNLPEEAADEQRGAERKRLQAGLRDALSAILSANGVRERDEYPVALSVDYAKHHITREVHQYTLNIVLKNVGTRRIEEWHVEVEMPTEVLDTSRSRPLKVPGRSNRSRTLFRMSEAQSGPLFPGDMWEMQVPYHVDSTMHWNRSELFSQVVTVTAFVQGKQAGVVEKPFRDLQKF